MFEKEPEHLATCVRSTGLNQGFRPPTHAPFRVQPMSNNNHRAIRIRLCTIDDLPTLQEAMRNCCAKRVCSRSQPSPLDRYQMRDVDPRGGRRCCDQRLIASANGHWLCVVRCKRRSASGLELNARCRRNCRPNWQRFRSVGIQKMILTRISSVPVDQSRRRRPRGSRQANRFWFHRLDGRYPPDTPHPAFCP